MTNIVELINNQEDTKTKIYPHLREIQSKQENSNLEQKSFMNAPINLEQIGEIIKLVTRQEREYAERINLPIATKKITGKSNINDLDTIDISKIKVYKFFDLINNKSENLSLKAVFGDFRELTSHSLIDNKLYFDLEDLMKKYEIFEKLLSDFKKQNDYILNIDYNTVSDIGGNSWNFELRNKLLIEKKEKYLWRAYDYFFGFLQEVNCLSYSSNNIIPKETTASSLEIFSGLKYKNNRELNSKNKKQLFFKEKKALKKVYLQIKEDIGYILGKKDKILENIFFKKTLNSKIIEEYNNTSILGRRKLQEKYFQNEQELYNLLELARQKGTNIRYSSKLFEDSITNRITNTKYEIKNTDLREELTRIYTYSKNSDEAINKIGEELKIIISKSSLYTQVREYRVKNNIEGRKGKLNGLEIERTDKNILKQYFESNKIKSNLDSRINTIYSSLE